MHTILAAIAKPNCYRLSKDSKLDECGFKNCGSAKKKSLKGVHGCYKRPEKSLDWAW
jgi:hypothetical protein